MRPRDGGYNIDRGPQDGDGRSNSRQERDSRPLRDIRPTAGAVTPQYNAAYQLARVNWQTSEGRTLAQGPAWAQGELRPPLSQPPDASFSCLPSDVPPFAGPYPQQAGPWPPQDLPFPPPAGLPPERTFGQPSDRLDEVSREIDRRIKLIEASAQRLYPQQAGPWPPQDFPFPPPPDVSSYQQGYGHPATPFTGPAPDAGFPHPPDYGHPPAQLSDPPQGGPWPPDSRQFPPHSTDPLKEWRPGPPSSAGASSIKKRSLPSIYGGSALLSLPDTTAVSQSLDPSERGEPQEIQEVNPSDNRYKRIRSDLGPARPQESERSAHR